jgi:hypothetical protein
MSIVYKLLDNGEFIVGDTKTRRTVRTSMSICLFKELIKEDQKEASIEMMEIINDIDSALYDRPDRVGYDAENWKILERENCEK